MRSGCHAGSCVFKPIRCLITIALITLNGKKDLSRSFLKTDEKGHPVSPLIFIICEFLMVIDS